ncbi:MAG: DUF4255 domain-containing protein [Cyanobacteria bacterium P01_F01_bin.153]
MIEHEVSRDFPGIAITIDKPQAPDKIKGSLINLFLYQVTPNPAWRNADLRTRRPKGGLIRHGQAGIDLHFLFTFYGDHLNCIPEQLLGSVLRALVDRPILTNDMIETALRKQRDPTLNQSTLQQQVQTIRFIPSEMTPDTIFRLWSTFFQIPYSLSFPYQASAVLIQGDRAGRVALPVRQRATYVFPYRPVIENIEHMVDGKKEPRLTTVTLNSELRLYGGDFGTAEDTRVQIGKVRIQPQSISDREIRLRFADVPDEERDQIQAGMSSIQVVRLALEKRSDEESDVEMAVESNAIPIVLCPQIASSDDVRLQGLRSNEESDDPLYSALVSVQLDFWPFPNQLIYLLLFGVSEEISGKTAIFRADKRLSQDDAVEFTVSGLKAGEYLDAGSD